MQQDYAFNPERFPTSQPENLEKSNEFAERWMQAFQEDDVPEFDDSSLWLAGDPQDNEDNEEINDASSETNLEITDDIVSPDIVKISTVERHIEQAQPHDLSYDYSDFSNSMGQANAMVGFGFDTTSRLYGIDAVLKAVMTVDETDRDAENPLGAVYEQIATTPEARLNLYREINKDNARTEDENSDLTNQTLNVGITPEGEFYDRNPVERRPDETSQASVDAIRAMKRMLELLETSEIFAPLRKRAAEKGMTAIEYLIDGYENPTISDLFARTNEELTASDVDAILTELTEQEEEWANREDTTEEA